MKQDIQKLLALLIERDIPVLGVIVNKYIERASPMKRKNFSSTDYAAKRWSNKSTT